MGLVMLAGWALTAWLVITRSRRARAELELELERFKLTSQLAGLESDRKSRALDLAKNRGEAAGVDAEIRELRSAVIKTHNETFEGKTAMEIALEFKKLGY